MSEAGSKGGLGTGGAVEVQASPPPRQNSGKRARQRELELKLAALQKDYADLCTALFEAAQVHRRLCAPRLVRHGDCEIASEIFAVRHLPGDFFTVEESSSGVVLALGDICGKGLAAGMWTTHLVGLVGTHTAASPEPEVIVTGVNRDLCRRSSVVPLTSLFLARLDPATGRLDYCSAGHPPTLLLRADGRLESLSEGGPLLGALPAASYARGRVELHAGDVLLAYSDGILESRNNADQEFGSERLEAQLRRTRTASAEAVLFSVLGAVQDFAAASPLADDMSLVAVRRGAPQRHA
ncbi:MAG: serine/threonine-protein phosphatase [Acidobacteria bacterium]|nr:serine/threonine-protein phosphatase [Acidobacteriota bacterium]MCI0720678.1 serine/threonine-protein phosphatase [Acidobacteriota bacterium]